MKDFNAFQVISVVGLIFSAIVHIILLLIDKKVHTVWALYPTWLFVFAFGYLLKRYSDKHGHQHEHHHHH
ncbi:MAG: hypothetical protein K2X86_16030 [Cytophagaceae bacterium]|nr:hypothetical protein [Cytophagaceae bacterium]